MEWDRENFYGMPQHYVTLDLIERIVLFVFCTQRAIFGQSDK